MQRITDPIKNSIEPCIDVQPHAADHCCTCIVRRRIGKTSAAAAVAAAGGEEQLVGLVALPELPPLVAGIGVLERHPSAGFAP